MVVVVVVVVVLVVVVVVVVVVVAWSMHKVCMHAKTILWGSLT